MQVILTTLMLGILLAIITSFLWNTAPILQKEALQKMKAIEIGDAIGRTRELFRNSRWVLGSLIALVGGATYLIATEMAGLVVVQPLMNVGLIALVIVSSKKFAEVIDSRAIVGIFLLILTPVFIAFSDVTEPIMFSSYDGILVYSIAIVASIGVMIPLSRKTPILWAPITSALQALASQCTQWFTLTLFSAESLVQGFIDSLIPLSLMAICSFVAAVYTVSIGLQKNPPVRFSSITSTVTMFAVIFGGIMIFGQVLTNMLFYATGLGFGVIGVILLSRFQDSKSMDQ